jgi:glycosyltransferase involved in cell wall biosynthesis
LPKKNQMKRVLIITYYWPPAGGAGVQRWLKFAKYLPEYDIEPIILTVEPGYASYPQIDQTLQNEISKHLKVFKTKSFEFYNVYKWFSKKGEIPYGGFANDTNESWLKKFSKFIRGNIFLPDPRRGWNRFAYKKAIEIIRLYQIDTIITTSPPHSTQLLGLKLKRKLNVRWIADLRDPWVDIFYYKHFNHTSIAKKIDLRYEKSVIENADTLITVSENLKQIFSSKTKYPLGERIHVIPNGYDHNDFTEKPNIIEPKKVISYIGTISELYDIEGFISALNKFDAGTSSKFLLRFVGKVSESIIKKLNETNIELEFIDYVPHNQAVDFMLRSSILLLVIPKVQNNKGIITGKFFEYLACQKPILALGPTDGDLAKLFDETQCGKIIDYSDSDKIHEYITNASFLSSVKKGTHEKYSRKALTAILAEKINS